MAEGLRKSRRSVSVSRIIFPSLAVVIAPSTAHADVVFPSVVQWLSAAGPYSLMVIPAILTIPLLIAISLLEALVVRRVLKPAMGAVPLIFVLFGINTFTSAIGLVTMPNGTELFPGLPLAFLATTIIEGLCLVVVCPKGRRRPNMSLFGTSALMNGASYAFLGFLLFVLIHLPSAMAPNNLDRRALPGEIVNIGDQNIPTLGIDPRAGKLVAPPKTPKEQESRYSITVISGKRWLMDTRNGRKIIAIPGKYRGDWQISDDGLYYANYIYNSANVVVVGNSGTGVRKEFRDVDEMALCGRTGRVALLEKGHMIIYDPANGHATRFGVYGVRLLSNVDMAWSPDGKYVAHTAIMSPFTQMLGDNYPDSVRVVSLKGQQATLVRNLGESTRLDSLDWLPRSK